MVVVECLDVGLTTLSKAAMSKGMSRFVFVVYSNALATLILLPSSFIFNRTKRPSLTFPLLCKFFLLSLTGITVMQNCVFTAATNWIIGGLFLATASLSVSIWNTSQAAILKGYPSEITIVAFYCFFGTIQCAVPSAIEERDHPSAWKLRPDIELVCVIYSAVFGSVVTFCAQTWCIHKKGPVFVAMFKPLGIAIATLMGVIFLGDTLHVGSVIGAVVIDAGILWSDMGAIQRRKGRSSCN
ncbi:hypothetical protein F0562_024813 [Nyssa sinensis]|uniref:WAT1-related protein n=1 Tax=Nyssa sinensis TaxID=561372 RepID=A0A5J5BEZ0_9ASTE|nr:hypothetical protein F0562_024813 [Nyssa sinensis]